MNPEMLMQILSMMGGAAGGMFGGRNPADAAQGYLDKLPGQAEQAYSPYINAGQSQIPGLEGQYGAMTGNLGGLSSAYGGMAGGIPGVQQQYGNLASRLPGIGSQLNNMMSNPGQFINKIGAGYKESPGFQFSKNQATDAANRAASAGGYVGSPAEQMQLGGAITGMANKDYGNWLDRALGAQGQGLQGGMQLGEFGLSGGERLGESGLAGEHGLYDRGLTGEEGLNQMGFQGSQQMADMIRDAMMSQANLGYEGQAAKNQQQGMNRAGLGAAGGAGLAAILSHFFNRGQ